MKIIKKLCAVLLFAAIPFFCGCRLLLSFDIPTYDSPSSTVSPEATTMPEDNDENANPVSNIYYSYYDAVQYPSERFAYHLEQDSSFAASDSLVYLAAHEMYVSEGMSTFGWLLSTDEGGYSSTVYGAAAGVGTISPNRTITHVDPEESDTAAIVEDHGGYVLSFNYNDGRTISGLLSDDETLSFTTSAPEGTCSVTLTHLEDGSWESSVERNGKKSVLRCGDSLEFILQNVANSTSTIYHWTDDPSSAHSIGN